MTTPIFITGIGTDVGKTLVSAIITEALQADYWKPVQAGYEKGTDTGLISTLISNNNTVIHPEAYRLALPASPHIAAAKEGITINAGRLVAQMENIRKSHPGQPLVIEGAGGLLVPLAESLMVADLAAAMHAKLVLVSRNYLGSINHSLLTAAYCKSRGLNVAGWIFSDDYMNYEEQIVSWTGYPSITSIPRLENIDKETIKRHADRIKLSLQKHLMGDE